MYKFLFQIDKTHVTKFAYETIMTGPVFAEVNYRIRHGLVWVNHIQFPYELIEYIKSPAAISADIQAAADHNAAAMGYLTFNEVLT